MPNINNLAQLKNAAGSSTFLNPSNPAYNTIRNFTNGLRTIQEELYKNAETMQLSRDLGKFADGLMALQVRQPLYGDAQVEQAIWDVNRNMAGFLQGGEGKTNYQTILETAQKANIMSKEELDRGLTIIGDTMGTNLNVGGSQRVEPAVQQNAPRQSAQKPPEHQSVRFMEWNYQHQADLKANTAGYASPKKELPEDKLFEQKVYMSRSAVAAFQTIQKLGAVTADGAEQPPLRNGVPSVFLMKDGKVTTLEENGIWMTKKEGDAVDGNPEFAKAVLRGEVFVYPAGERHPVQLQVKDTSAQLGQFTVECSGPLKPGEATLAPEPTVTRQPRWYHRAFKFWGNNRKICTDYETSKAAHDKWKAIANEAEANAKAIEEKFGAKRTGEVRNAELTDAFRVVDAKRVQKNQIALNVAEKNMNKLERGIGNVMELYAAKPVFKEEYTTPEKKLYTKELFQKLDSTDLDPGTVKIGGNGVSEREFATLAMFGSLDPKLSVQVQQKNALDKPGPMLDSLQKEGYSEEMSRRIVGSIIGTASTVDVFTGDSRIQSYFDNAINGGRKNAADALKAYPQDKSKLAEILANGLVFTGELLGSTSNTATQHVGSKGMAQLSKEMLDMMERDPELKQLTKEQFEKTEKSICGELNQQIEKYTDRKNVLKPKSFDDTVKLIDNFRKLSDLEQKGLEAEHKLAAAQAREVDLLPEDKMACVKDILKSNMVCSLYEQERLDRGHLDTKWHTVLPDGTIPRKQPNGQVNYKYEVEGKHNSTRFAQHLYTKALEERGPHIGIDPETGLQDYIDPDLPREQWVDKGVPVAIHCMEARFTEKAPTVSRMGNPAQMAELDRQAEQIIKQDGLDKLSLEELNQKLVVGKDYKMENMLMRVGKLGQDQLAQNQQKNLELDQNQLGNNRPVPPVVG